MIRLLVTLYLRPPAQDYQLYDSQIQNFLTTLVDLPDFPEASTEQFCHSLTTLLEKEGYIFFKHREEIK